MNFLQNIAEQLARRFGFIPQKQDGDYGSYSDVGELMRTFSVEHTISGALANLMYLNFEMPIDGDSARASWLDDVADDFVRDRARVATVQTFLTGDSITVPTFNGRNIENTVVPANNFAVIGNNGDELTSVLYVVDEKQLRTKTVTLLRWVRLIPFTREDGSTGYINRYETLIAEDGRLTDTPLSDYPDWAANNEETWDIPNVDRLLVARLKSHVVNPLKPNEVKGTKICYGAAQPIKEIHTLTENLSDEFEMSQKAIFTPKRMLTAKPIMDANGVQKDVRYEMPKGKGSRLFQMMGGERAGKDMPIEWAPSINYQPYVDALDFQFKRVEKCVGVNTGVISNPTDENTYTNVDNVRKSTIQTQSFINSARAKAENYFDSLVYIWDVIANYYEITPMGSYSAQYQWSDDYINTFVDQQAALLAGVDINATDAADYRMFVMGEAPDVAKARVAEIEAERGSRFKPIVIEDVE